LIVEAEQKGERQIRHRVEKLIYAKDMFERQILQEQDERWLQMQLSDAIPRQLPPGHQKCRLPWEHNCHLHRTRVLQEQG